MNRNLLILLGLAFLLTACGGKKGLVFKHPDSRSARDGSHSSHKDIVKNKKDKSTVAKPNFKSDIYVYIEKYHKIAEEEMDAYGIPASITLAQGIFESASGQSELARKSNNHFGIKCHGWKGQKVYHDDDKRQECFRKYKDPKYSFRDHSLFLKDRKRYSALFDLAIDDYKAWAKGLKAAGYATNPVYANQLIDIIERYDLHRYDEVVVHKNRMDADDKAEGQRSITPIKTKEKTPEEAQAQSKTLREENEDFTTNNKTEIQGDLQDQNIDTDPVSYDSDMDIEEVSKTSLDTGIHVVQKGETLYGLSKQYNVSIEQLKLMNRLEDNTLSIGQELVVPKN